MKKIDKKFIIRNGFLSSLKPSFYIDVDEWKLLQKPQGGDMLRGLNGKDKQVDLPPKMRFNYECQEWDLGVSCCSWF